MPNRENGFLRYEFTVGIAYENNPTEAVKIVLETINKVYGVLTGERGPSVTVDELSTNSININVNFWIDTFQSTRRSVHHSIRSKLLDDVVKALIAEGFSMPASIVEIKNYEPYGDLRLDVKQDKIVDK